MAIRDHSGIKFFSGIIFYFLICFSLSASRPVSVNYPDPLFEPWRWKFYSELSDKGIRCMTEGENGSMWFGTAKGLVYYDGLSWKTFKDENEVLQSPVYGLCYTKSGVLFIVSQKGISQYDKGKWTTVILFPENKVFGSEWEILNINETSGGDIWAGLHFGLVRIHNNRCTVYTTPSTYPEAEEFFRNADVVDVSKTLSLQTFMVFDILEDHFGNIWYALEDGTLLKLDKSNRDPGSAVNFKKYDSNDGLMIGRLPLLFNSKEGIIYNISQSVAGGINTFNPSSEKWNSFKLSTLFGGDDLNFSISQTTDGDIWIGGLSRFFTLKKGTWKEYKQPALAVPPTRILFHPASDGSLWLAGHQADVIRIDYLSDQWATYKDLMFQCETAGGNAWFLSSDGKVVTYNEKEDNWYAWDEEFPMSHPVRIFPDRSSRLWAVGSHDGVAALAWFSDNSWNLRLYPDLCWGFNQTGVYVSTDNSVYISVQPDCGNGKWGILKFNPSNGPPYDEGAWHHYKGSEITQVAYAICETDDRKILFGSYLGLFEYNGSVSRSLHDIIMQDIIKVEAMVKGPAGGVWIGTRSHGIIHYIDDKNWTQYTTDDGLASNSISSLIVSGDSTIWAATDKGISRFDGKYWTKYALPEYFRIVRGTGMLRPGTNSSIYVVVSSNEWYRRVYYKKDLSSENSINITYRITPETMAPETEISMWDKKVYYPGNTLISWSGSDKWNSTSTDQLQFSYRLNNQAWSEFTTEKNHQFLALKKGRYTLEVRARDNFLNVDETPAAIRFKVIPPVWGQAWFILLIAGFLGTIAFLLYSSIRKNKEMTEQNLIMKQKNEEMAKQQKEIEEKSRQIMELLEKEREKEWLNEGILMINEIIKLNSNDLQKLTITIIEKLIDYLKVNAGGVILHRKEENSDDEYLELVAAYGYNRQRLEQRRMYKGEGLTGACFKEKKTLVINNVPETYFINSGLGSAQLTELVLVPLKMLDQIIGILEISSLYHIEPQKIKMLEMVSENIASHIINLESKSKIQNMYEVSKQQAEQLHERDEELHQQMEEIQATQEESRRREEMLQKELNECRLLLENRARKKKG